MPEQDLTDRLQRLEARVAELEARLGNGPTPPLAAAPPPTPAPPPAAPTPSGSPTWPAPWPEPASAAAPPQPRSPSTRSPQPAARRDLERFFGLAVLGRIGIAAVLLAAAYFGQLGWNRLGPAGRTVSIYALAAALLALGATLRPRVAPRYTALLWGGATALTYLAGALAHMRFGLFGPAAAFAALLASAALGQLLARILRLEAMATVALGGAFAAPVLVDAPSPTPTALFVLLLALHAWAAFTEHRWQWRAARGLAVAAATALGASWYATHAPGPTWSVIAHAEVLLVGLAAPELLAAFAHGRVGTWRWLAVVAGASAVQFALLVLTANRGECLLFGPVAALACGSLGAALAPRAVALGTGPARLGSVLLPLGIWFLIDGSAAAGTPRELLGWWRLGGLGAAAAALAAVRRWTRVGDLGLALAALLATGIALGEAPRGETMRLMAAATAAIALLLVQFGRARVGPTCGLVIGCAVLLFGLWPEERFVGSAAHWSSVAFAASGGIATLGAMLAVARKDRLLAGTAAALLVALGVGWAAMALRATSSGTGESAMWPLWNWRFLSVALVATCAIVARRLQPPDEAWLRHVLAGLILALAFVGGLLEVLEAIAGWEPAWHAVTTSLYTLLFAAGLLTAGFVRAEAPLRWCGLAGFAATVVKIAAFDLAAVDTPLRVLATGALGAVLLAGAWAYSRRAAGA